MKFTEHYEDIDLDEITLSEKTMPDSMKALAKELDVDFKDGDKNWWEDLKKWLFTIKIPGKETTFAASDENELKSKYAEKIKAFA